VVKLTLPIYWEKVYKTKKNKVHLIGMNFYRNAHYFDKNNLKSYIQDIVYDQIKDKDPISLEFYRLDINIYYKNPSCDGANIASVIEKFTLDALQTVNVVPEDNVKHHKGSTWNVAGRDKENPRCEIVVTQTD
jgi:hypothetical protein